MLKGLRKSRWDDLILPDQLRSWLRDGFVRKYDCVFLNELLKFFSGNNDFVDKTGLECFVNSFHIDDYVEERFLDYACLFCNTILQKWEMEGGDEILNVIVSMDDFGAVVRFHIKRSGESWLSSD
ncbi:hypothetical protein KDH83_31535, partial [Achromobacter sp. Marseille-Q0513]|uniref:hypothetical protein n=1 Tax=Achromobacter sp. Marseille-Q0513 TaxID=2829161 RepID=UPI001B979D52